MTWAGLLLRTCVIAPLLATAFGAAGQEAPQRPFPLPPAEWPATINDTPTLAFFLADRLEYRWQEGTDALLWDAQGWIGGDWNKFWFKTEGEDPADGAVEEAEVQALYARLISPFWYLQTGVRYDFEPAPSRAFAVLGVQGLGLYWFEVDAAAFVSDDGDLSARFEAEYDLLFTQRLVLQPRFETNLAFQDVPELGIGQGFNDVQLGLRLRYEIRREFAPYAGIAWVRKVGETADRARTAGEDVDSLAVVAGLRLWF